MFVIGAYYYLHSSGILQMQQLECSRVDVVAVHVLYFMSLGFSFRGGYLFPSCDVYWLTEPTYISAKVRIFIDLSKTCYKI